ncbi:hypothetical protein PIB30_031276 [Stylosanthes scabra]|uniref:Uncharacterized protein n=1 Tax=Stylosanthes scabra TaxID=79078 RepID=A0ABU6YAD2_9FABA|nr:hypothetical protein [Stylosanthes scabra]
MKNKRNTKDEGRWNNNSACRTWKCIAEEKCEAIDFYGDCVLLAMDEGGDSVVADVDITTTTGISDFVVVTLYPNGEMGRDAGGIWFRSAILVVFQMQPVNTLEELKAVILRNMGVGGGTMYGPREVMELLTEMQTVDGDVGGPSSSTGGEAGVIPCSPIHFTAPDASMQLELNSEGLDEDFVWNGYDSSESSDGSEFVLESQCRRDYLLQAPPRLLICHL